MLTDGDADDDDVYGMNVLFFARRRRPLLLLRLLIKAATSPLEVCVLPFVVLVLSFIVTMRCSALACVSLIFLADDVLYVFVLYYCLSVVHWEMALNEERPAWYSASVGEDFKVSRTRGHCLFYTKNGAVGADTVPAIVSHDTVLT